ncbi:hypothetical protein FB45DRAFT_1148962 [Roridomyces roridus]|uniref:MYND-type domain-containing protein n=1 Tax=Roridomyces roridus TaxID=1738132 RepID=A0AAD7BY03_9AGAR|nr:hypothetical protein FB45DRAFT_1148962 [Roridomyces roridus]
MDLERCAQCLRLYYCSIECQRIDWQNGHRVECNTHQQFLRSGRPPFKTSRQRYFMRKLLDRDYRDLKLAIFTDAVKCMRTSGDPSQGHFVLFDYTRGIPEYDVISLANSDSPSFKLLKDAGLEWEAAVARAAHSDELMVVHVVRVLEGDSVRHWVLPLRCNNEKIHEKLVNIASDDGEEGGQDNAELVARTQQTLLQKKKGYCRRREKARPPKNSTYIEPTADVIEISPTALGRFSLCPTIHQDHPPGEHRSPFSSNPDGMFQISASGASTPTHILSLPEEITSKILIHFLPGYAEFPRLYGRDSPSIFLLICTQWRDVALATPELWNTIQVDGLVRGMDQHPLLEAWLQRSGNRPLFMDLFLPEMTSSLPLLESVFQHASRWLEVKITYHLFEDIPDLMPLLHKLEIGFTRPIPASAKPRVVFVEAPNLKILSLVSFANPSTLTFPWSQLTTLSLKNVGSN